MVCKWCKGDGCWNCSRIYRDARRRVMQHNKEIMKKRPIVKNVMYADRPAPSYVQKVYHPDKAVANRLISKYGIGDENWSDDILPERSMFTTGEGGMSLWEMFYDRFFMPHNVKWATSMLAYNREDLPPESQLLYDKDLALANQERLAHAEAVQDAAEAAAYRQANEDWREQRTLQEYVMAERERNYNPDYEPGLKERVRREQEAHAERWYGPDLGSPPKKAKKRKPARKANWG